MDRTQWPMKGGRDAGQTSQGPPDRRGGEVSGERQADDGRVDLRVAAQEPGRNGVGQEKLREKMRILVEAARQRERGRSTTCFCTVRRGWARLRSAHILAHEIQGNLKPTSGPAIEKAGDLAAIVTNLRKGDILFIDEIHRLGRVVEEILYPAMEDFVLDITVGSGPSARSIRLKLPRFTVIGATTRLALMTGAAARPVLGLWSALTSTVGRLWRRLFCGRRPCWRRSLTTKGRRRLHGVPEVRRGWRCGCCGGCGTMRRCGGDGKISVTLAG